ncbi:MAG: hypothetical protein ACRDJJ_10295 [Actinomycetota bacterium]
MLAKTVVALCFLASIVACGNNNEQEAPSTVTGVVIEVSSAGLGRVESLVVKDGDDTFEILIDPDVDYGFNLDHLHEHRATGDPVRVELDQRDGDLYAQTIEDA